MTGTRMRRVTTLLIALGAGTIAATAQDRTGDLRGVVVDTAGRPIARAVINVSGKQAGRRTRRSDEKGRFRFEDFPRGEFNVRVEAPGYLSQSRESLNSIASPVSFIARADTAILIGPICTGMVVPALSISVRDSVSGENLAGTATGTSRFGNGTEQLSKTTVVDERTVRTFGTGASYFGRYRLKIRHKGYRTWRRDVEVPGDVCHAETQTVNALLVPERE